MPCAGIKQVDGAAADRFRSHADRAVDEADVVGAEFLEQLVEFDQRLGVGFDAPNLSPSGEGPFCSTPPVHPRGRTPRRS
jgi:hypothetical protein